jgi:hypothetical protein
MLLLSLLLLSATPAPRLAMPGLTPVNISPAEAGLHSEVLAQELMRRGLEITTSRDIQTLLGVERQRQLMGCDAQSCIAELADALGAAALVQGDVGRVDARWSVTIRIISSRDGATLAAFSGQTLENVAALLDHAAGVLAQTLSDKLHLGLVPVAEASAAKPVSRWWALVPGVVAVGGGVMGAAFTSQAAASRDALRAATFREDAQLAMSQGVSQQNLAWVGFGVAAAGVVGAAAILVFGGEPKVAPVLALDARGGGLVGVTGVWP